MPLIRLSEYVLHSTESGAIYTFDPHVPKLTIDRGVGEPSTFTARDSDPAAVWAALLEQVAPAVESPDRFTRLEEAVAAIDADLRRTEERCQAIEARMEEATTDALPLGWWRPSTQDYVLHQPSGLRVIRKGDDRYQIRAGHRGSLLATAPSEAAGVAFAEYLLRRPDPAVVLGDGEYPEKTAPQINVAEWYSASLFRSLESNAEKVATEKTEPETLPPGWTTDRMGVSSHTQGWSVMDVSGKWNLFKPNGSAVRVPTGEDRWKLYPSRQTAIDHAEELMREEREAEEAAHVGPVS